VAECIVQLPFFALRQYCGFKALTNVGTNFTRLWIRTNFLDADSRFGMLEVKMNFQLALIPTLVSSPLPRLCTRIV
jgi:hypothetical protein